LFFFSPDVNVSHQITGRSQKKARSSANSFHVLSNDDEAM
jgi:hypothetical protein